MNDKDRYWDCLDLAMEASHGGRTDEALAWLEEALKARPGGAEAHNGRGEILWDEGRVEEALLQFETAMQADANFITAYLNRAELLIEELGEFERAIQQCDDLLTGAEGTPRLDRPTEAEVYYLKAKALFYLEDFLGALFLVRRASKTAGDIAVYHAFTGQILFELGRFAEARRQLEYSVLLDGDAPHALYHYALALERVGEESASRRNFLQANALDPDHFPMPVVISEPEFEQAVERAFADLPASIRDYVEGIPVLVQEFPEDNMFPNHHLSPQLLGLFVGVPRTEAEISQQRTDIDRIYLFKKNLEKICRTRAELVEQIQITIKHEIGHYLGLDENDLERLGLA